MAARVLIAGLGNIFLGDDGFGVEVVRRLADDEPIGGAVEIADFGVRGIHLAFELADDRYDGAILVDLAPRGGTPGTLYVIEPAAANDGGAESSIDAHALTPSGLLAWLDRLGGTRCRVVIVGCEPASVDEAMGLSQPVAAVVDLAVQLVREQAIRLSGELLSGELSCA
jgi:hydrogenase maturation protease